MSAVMTPLQTAFSAAFPSLTPQFEFLLAPITYFKIGGPAEIYLELADRTQVGEIVRFCREHHAPLTLLGGASNVLIDSAGLRGVVLRLTDTTFEVLEPATATTPARILAGTGWKTSLFGRRTLDLGLTGMETFLGVPGFLSGAIVNNAHYLEDLIGQFIARVQVVTPEGETIWLTHDECDFSYDHSRFHHSGEVVIAAEFTFPHGDPAESQAKVVAATQYRAKTQPLGEPSSGCYFQNAPNTPALKERFPQFAARKSIGAGFLIDQAGLKGYRVGEIVISQKHAAFFINLGQGTSQQVKELETHVRRVINDQFGVELKPEVFTLSTSSTSLSTPQPTE
jgi:UDP-N-acetylmuramate dehydrogenase